MAVRTVAPGGGSWTSASTWVEGIVPTSADDVYFTASSGNVTMPGDATSAITMYTSTFQCRNLDFTGYTGTLAFTLNSYLCVTGTSLILSPTTTYTYTSISIQCIAILDANCSVTSNGSDLFHLMVTNYLSNTTINFLDNLSCTRFTIAQLGDGNQTAIMNGSVIYPRDFIANSGSTYITSQGTTTFYFNKTGASTIQTSNVRGTGCNIVIDTTGTLTFGTMHLQNGGSLTYIQGTVTWPTTSLTTRNNVTLNLPNVTLNNVITNFAGTVTLSAPINITLWQITAVTPIVGCGNLTCQTMTVSGATTLTLDADLTLYHLNLNSGGNYSIINNNKIYITNRLTTTTISHTGTTELVLTSSCVIDNSYANHKIASPITFTEGSNIEFTDATFNYGGASNSVLTVNTNKIKQRPFSKLVLGGFGTQTTIMNAHLLNFETVNIFASTSLTLSEFFQGTASKPVKVVGLGSTPPYRNNIIFTDTKLKYARFVKLQGLNIVNPGQLKILTPNFNKKYSNQFGGWIQNAGLAYANVGANGISLNMSKFTESRTMVGGLLADPTVT